MIKLVLDTIHKLNLPQIQFADVRYTSTDSEDYYFEKGELKNYSAVRDHESIGIRVLINGCWGFCGLNEFSEAKIDQAIRSAIGNAEHGSKFKRHPVDFPTVNAVRRSYYHKPEKDPFLMDREQKMQYLLYIAQRLQKASTEQIIFNYLMVKFHRQYKIYANTEGTLSDSLQYETSPEFQVMSSDGNGVQRRTYPGDMSAKKGGFEIVENYRFEENIDRIIRESVDLLKAPQIEEEKADIIIGGSQLALQLHESVGHATEADRIFGMEISYAGKTFVNKEMIGKFQYASPIVNIISDSSDERGIGYHPVDDEGIPGKRVDIVRNGILVNQQTGREIAHMLGLEPSSNMKSSYGYDFPLVRMTNFSLLPGSAGTLQDLIRNTEKGYLLDYTKTWSIDDNRNNFQFTTEIGWKIKDGEIAGMVKEPTYYGITPQFWNACDAVCGKEEWQYFGTFNCGKGEPGQAMHLSHGVAPARFKNITVNIKA